AVVAGAGRCRHGDGELASAALRVVQFIRIGASGREMDDDRIGDGPRRAVEVTHHREVLKRRQTTRWWIATRTADARGAATHAKDEPVVAVEVEGDVASRGDGVLTGEDRGKVEQR